MSSLTAEGLEGFILFDPIRNKYFFRVYDEQFKYKDYELRIESLKVKILSDASLYEGHCKNYIGWSERAFKSVTDS